MTGKKAIGNRDEGFVTKRMKFLEVYFYFIGIYNKNKYSSNS